MRYVLEGSVQRSSNQVRVNAHLVDAATDAHLWADRFAGDIGDLFALQDDITGCIANALSLALISMEATRPTQHPDALDYIFRRRALAFGKSPSRDNSAEAIKLFEQATHRRADRDHACRRTRSSAATVIPYTSAPWATVMPSFTKTRIHANCDRGIWRIDRLFGADPRLYIVVTDWRRRHFRYRGLRVGGSAAPGCGGTCRSSARRDRHAENIRAVRGTTVAAAVSLIIMLISPNLAMHRCRSLPRSRV